MLHLSISLRALVFVVLLMAGAVAGSDVARGAPARADLTADTLIRFQTTGQDVAHDINVADNRGGLRFFSCPELTITPQCAAIQFFGNASTGFPGQLFIDSGANSNAAIIFRTASTGGTIGERLRIDAIGRVQSGTGAILNCSHAGDICAGDDLVAQQNVHAGGTVFATSSVLAGFQVRTGGLINACNNGGDICAGEDVQADGDVIVGSGCVRTFSGTELAGDCPSDVRLKRDIAPFASVLGRLAALQPVTFHWRVDEFPDREMGPGLNYGLLAQDVEPLLPELVSEDGEGYKGVRYHLLPLYLLQGMREMKSENEALREQNASLEARLAAIEKRLSGSREQ